VEQVIEEERLLVRTAEQLLEARRFEDAQKAVERRASPTGSRFSSVIECARAYHTRSRRKRKSSWLQTPELRRCSAADAASRRWVGGWIAGSRCCRNRLPHAGAAVAQRQPSGGALRDRYEKPRQQQKLDDAIRKFGEEDVQTRLEGVEGLGENAEDAKAIEYLLRGAADADLSVRVKAIDVVGNARLKQPCRCSCSSSSCATRRSRRSSTSWPSLGKIGDRAPPSRSSTSSRATSTRACAAARSMRSATSATAPRCRRSRSSRRTDGRELPRLTQSAIRKIEQKPAPAVVPPALADRRRPAQAGSTRPKALRSRGRSVRGVDVPLQSLLERLGDERA
jgi:hypothetical protein